MSNDPFLSLLGLCRRASRLSVGHDAAKLALRNKEACLCILTADASVRLQEEMRGLAGERPVLVTEYTMEDFKGAIGKKAGVVSVNDEGFAAKLTQLTIKEGFANGSEI